MDQSELNNINNEINANIVDLESLNTQFANTYNNYITTYTTYMSYLDSLPTSTSNNNSMNNLVSIQDVSNSEYLYIQGKMIMAPEQQRISVTDLSTNDISGCQAICQSLPNCTGATFDSESGNCWAYSGNYTLSNGKDTDYVMFPLSTQLLMQLQTYNSQLLTLNNQILTTLKNTQPVLNEEIELNNIAQLNAIGYKQRLLEQQKEILKLLEEQDDYIQNKNDTYKVVNSYYTQYKITVFVVILLLVLTLVIFQGVDRRLFIVTIVISLYFIFKFNFLSMIMVLVILKLLELNFFPKEKT
jgi:hypothetical protein